MFVLAAAALALPIVALLTTTPPEDPAPDRTPAIDASAA
jgi:hypothetical protein